MTPQTAADIITGRFIHYDDEYRVLVCKEHSRRATRAYRADDCSELQRGQETGVGNSVCRTRRTKGLLYMRYRITKELLYIRPAESA